MLFITQRRGEMKVSELIDFDGVLRGIRDRLPDFVPPDDSSNAQVNLVIRMFKQAVLSAMQKKGFEYSKDQVDALFKNVGMGGLKGLQDFEDSIAQGIKKEINNTPNDPNHVRETFDKLYARLRQWSQNTEIGDPQKQASLKKP